MLSVMRLTANFLMGLVILVPGCTLAHCEPLLPEPIQDPVINLHKFTLKQAVYLTLKYNQSVESDSLGQEANYWSVRSAYYGYEPQFNVSGSAAFVKGSQPTYALSPTATWTSLIGTTANFSYTPNFLQNVGTGNSSAGFGSLTVTQPLLNGFGVAFNSIALKTAIYSYQTTNLAYKSSLIQAVNTTIVDFRQVVTSIHSLEDSRASVEAAKQQVKNTRLKLANDDPNTAPSDLVQMEQLQASSELNYLESRNQVETSYQTLLSDIGLPTSAVLHLDDRVDVSKSMIPNTEWAIRYAFAHNISYLTQKIAVESAKLTIISARNAAKWTLTLSGNADIIGNTGVNAAGTQVGILKNASATLAIPILNVTNHSAIVSAEIALAQAQITLASDQRALETRVRNEITNATSRYEQWNLAQAQVILDRDTLRAAVIKQTYGQGSAFEVNRLQTTLLNDEIQMNNIGRSFQNSISDINVTLGRMLDVWGVHLKY
ncbi:MAG: hypothetical protein A3F17_04315 [Gammaproteobacteria bacterium RIFCSPHIGHO2_12_FULL_41_15]|nr:MAG: hypothetical protein A3F17_04315 [Gammaproteobacteria bacterium RIFCSPHIGHO2_12_FULL_41_15]